MSGIKIKCIQCGKEFESFNQRKTCSEACRKARKRDQDMRCKNGRGRVGTVAVCPICGKKFTVKGTTQKYCSDKCCGRARTLTGVNNKRTVPATCIICGKDFLTSQNAKAKTCSKECATKYRSQKLRQSAQRSVEAAKPQPGPWQHPMRCPWEDGLFDTPPAYGVSWMSAEADPMSAGWDAGGVWVEVREAEAERRKAA